MRSLPFGKNKGKALQLLEKKEEKAMLEQKVKIGWVEDGEMEVCLIASYLPRVRKIDPAISQEVEDQFKSGQIVNISVDDEGYVRKVEAA